MSSVTRVSQESNTLLDTPPALSVSEAQQFYYDGFDAYCDKRPLSEMPTRWHRMGWLSANKAEAVAFTVDYEEDMLDREFWRKGQW